MKLLKPAMRKSKRYLLLEGSFSKKEVEKRIMDYIGILGFSKASPRWVGKNILAINRESINEVRASFVLLPKVRVKNVSGTLKRLKEK
jgi:RNase P/RNase MRP subunit POP5